MSDKRQAKLLPDYGTTKGLMKKAGPVIDRMNRLIAADDLMRLRKLKTILRGSVSDLADSSIPPEFSQYLDDEGYSWEVEFGPFNGRFLRKATYTPSKNKIEIVYNTALPSALGSHWDEYKAKVQRDMDKSDVTFRHELTHLLRDADTGHIKEYTKRMKEDPRVYEKYRSRGHQEMEFEIDAIVNGIDQLRKRIGPEKFDKLKPSDLERMLLVQWPKDTKTLSKWVKRLMREDMLTTGMRKEWRLGRASSVAERVAAEFIFRCRGV